MRLLYGLIGASRSNAVFANTMSGGKLFACALPQNEDLDVTGYEALTWVQVKGVGSHGETGTTQNIVTYDTWDTVFEAKAKGIANAGDPDVELARMPTDPGQLLMRSQGDALDHNSYAFKIERNDAPTGGTPTQLYNRGIVTGPRITNGRNEDFDLETFTLGMQQQQIIVEAAEA